MDLSWLQTQMTTKGILEIWTVDSTGESSRSGGLCPSVRIIYIQTDRDKLYMPTHRPICHGLRVTTRIGVKCLIGPCSCVKYSISETTKFSLARYLTASLLPTPLSRLFSH